jgi:hypothetical protein
VAEGNQEYADKLLQTLKPAEVIYQRSNQKSFKEKVRDEVLYLYIRMPGYLMKPLPQKIC